MPVTATDVVNQAIQFIGDNQPLVTGSAPSFDDSPAGIAASKLYAPCVATVQRQFEWDASRSMIALVASGNVAPFPWTVEYLYPPHGIQVWEMMPSIMTDLNDPLPTTWIVGNTVVGVPSVQQRVIWTNLANAVAIYNNNPSEDTWESTFREAVVRLLSSELAMALAGKPDLSQVMLESAGSFGGAATERRG